MMKTVNGSRWERGLAIGLLAIALGWWSGCQSAAARDEAVPPRIYLETGPGEAGIAVTLPVSGATLIVRAQPVLTEYDVTMVRAESAEGGRGVELTLRPAAAAALHRMRVRHAGRRLVMMASGQAIGVRVLDGAASGDRLLIYLEQPDRELTAWVARLRRGALGGMSGVSKQS